MSMLYDGFHKIEMIESEVKGKKVKRELLHLKSAVGILLTDDEGSVAMVKQYRPTLGRYTLEIPAGLLDKPDLNPIQALKEEIIEELEVDIDLVTINESVKIDFNMITGSSPAVMTVYTGSYKGIGEDTENIFDADIEGIYWVSVREIHRMIDRKEIMDSKTMLAMHMLR